MQDGDLCFYSIFVKHLFSFVSPLWAWCWTGIENVVNIIVRYWFSKGVKFSKKRDFNHKMKKSFLILVEHTKERRKTLASSAPMTIATHPIVWEKSVSPSLNLEAKLYRRTTSLSWLDECCCLNEENTGNEELRRAMKFVFPRKSKMTDAKV